MIVVLRFHKSNFFNVNQKLTFPLGCFGQKSKHNENNGYTSKIYLKKKIPCNKKIDYRNFQTRPQKFQNFKKS